MSAGTGELRTDAGRNRARVAIGLRQVAKPRVIVGALGSLRTAKLPANADEFAEFLARHPSPTTLDARGAWDEAERILEACRDQGIVPVAIGDPRFPARLVELQEPARPRGVSLGGYCPILYCKGSVEALHGDCAAAVVGTREPTEFGRRRAYEFGRTLAQDGVVVVSGLARGCDTGAHKGCVDVGGRSVAVLAHGLDRVYPPENADLADALVAAGGCLVSEYPPGVAPQPRYFGCRDRIQAGLADLVVVIETPVRDGTMITVEYARKQRRPVACLTHPSGVDDHPASAGNRLLLSGGGRTKATPLDEPQDALRLLRNESRPATGPASTQPSLLDGPPVA